MSDERHGQCYALPPCSRTCGWQRGIWIAPEDIDVEIDVVTALNSYSSTRQNRWISVVGCDALVQFINVIIAHSSRCAATGSVSGCSTSGFCKGAGFGDCDVIVVASASECASSIRPYPLRHLLRELRGIRRILRIIARAQAGELQAREAQYPDAYHHDRDLYFDQREALTGARRRGCDVCVVHAFIDMMGRLCGGRYEFRLCRGHHPVFILYVMCLVRWARVPGGSAALSRSFSCPRGCYR